MDNEFETSKFQQTLNQGQELFGKFGQWIGNQRHFSAIRDAFATFIPLLIVGSFAILINSVFILDTSLVADISGVVPGGTDALSQGWANMSFYVAPIFDGIAGATMDFFAVYLSFLFGYFLTKSYDGESLFGGLLSMSVFLVLRPIAADPSLKYLGSSGILLAMFSGLTAPTIYNKLVKSGKLAIGMPEGVPPAVVRSFNALIPLSVVLIGYGLIQPTWGAISYASGIGSMEQVLNLYEINVTFDYVDSAGNLVTGATEVIKAYDGSELFGALEAGANPSTNQLISALEEMGYSEITNVIPGTSTLLSETSTVIDPEIYYVFNAINTFLFLPLSNATDSAAMVFVVLLFITLFWFFGVHGPNVMQPFVSTFWTTATIANVNLVSDLGSLSAALDSGQLAVWTETTMNAFVFIGGAGSTLALVVGVLIFSKVQSTKQIATIATPTGVFQINEPVIFGFPILLNFRWFIPFVFVTPISGIVIYYATASGLLNPVTVLIPWTTPVFVSGFLATLDWRSIIWTFIIFGFSFISYLPFVLLDTKSQLQVVEKEQLELTEEEYVDNTLLTKTVNLRKELFSYENKMNEEIELINQKLTSHEKELIKTNNETLRKEIDGLKEQRHVKTTEMNKEISRFKKEISTNETKRIKYDMNLDKFDNLISINQNNLDEKINQANVDYEKFIQKNETKISNIEEIINNKNLYIEKLNELLKENSELITELSNEEDNQASLDEINNLTKRKEKLESKLEKLKLDINKLNSKFSILKENFDNKKQIKEQDKNNYIEKITFKYNSELKDLENKKEAKLNNIIK